MDYSKRFSVGLPVLDPVERFHAFLDRYAPYIANVYFSLPLGDKHHSRIVTQRILREEDKIPYFLSLLRCVKNHGIHLEVLFNTAGLSEEDILTAKVFMDIHGIEPDEIGIRMEYHEMVTRIFPGKPLVYSFNNFPSSREAFFSSEKRFQQYVVGRQFIRDAKLLDEIRQHDAKTVLLLNNGCSFTCGGCGNGNHCHDAYYAGRERYSPEYLYALQSIMPFEINEGFIDVEKVDLFKIASRNGNVDYLQQCMDSYMINDASGTESDPERYLLWSRLLWHADSFADFSYDRIREIKLDIYRDAGHWNKYRIPAKPVGIDLDLSDRFSLSGIELADALLKQSFESAERKLHLPSGKAQLQRVYLGISACQGLLQHMNADALARNIRFLRRRNILSVLMLPPLTGSRESVCGLLQMLQDQDSLPDEFVANDQSCFFLLKNNYQRPVALGRALEFKAFNQNTEELDCSSEKQQRKALFSAENREYLRNVGAAYILCDMNESGLWISGEEEFPVKVYCGHRILKKQMLCPFQNAEGCHGECLHAVDRYQLGTNLYTGVRFTMDVASTRLENRCAFVFDPMVDGDAAINPVR